MLINSFRYHVRWGDVFDDRKEFEIERNLIAGLLSVSHIVP